jgi:tetraacyldisaccharide 4'-kinase
MRKFRLFLLPFAWIYGGITSVRNLFFDVGIFKSYKIPKKSICVGNLSVGGTGKTPHVAYLTKLVKESTKTTILSRGYGRNTTGFILANSQSKGSEIGDEPRLYVSRFSPEVNVVVCEKRVVGVQKIQELFPQNQLILLDDAYQHRAIKAELNILLTDYSDLYSDDHVLPAGNLREWKSGKKRADMLIVTKCPESLSENERKIISQKLKFNFDKTFFSRIQYGALIPFGKVIQKEFNNILLVTGIANSTPLLNQLKKKFNVEILSFSDHHNFNEEDIQRIHQKFDTFVTDSKAIITTEKDFMRLSEMIESTKIKEYPWLYQEIEVEIDKKEIFNKTIIDYVNSI